jgi:hypothetical protein
VTLHLYLEPTPMSQESLSQLDNELDADAVEAIPVPAPNAPEPLSMRAVLRVVTMRRLWYAQIVSTFGDFLALFAVITYMTFRLHATPQQASSSIAGPSRQPSSPATSSAQASAFFSCWSTPSMASMPRLRPSASSPASSVLRRV